VSETPKSSADVRDALVRALHMDVYGPDTRPFAHETHMENEEVLEGVLPSAFYMMGYLAPAQGAVLASRKEEDERIQEPLGLDDDEAGQPDADDDDGGIDVKQKRRLQPSSLGFTAFVHKDCPHIDIDLRYADYIAQPPIPEDILDGSMARPKGEISWHRKPNLITYQIKRAHLERAATGVTVAVPLDGTSSPQRRGGALELQIIVHEAKLPRPKPRADWETVWAVSLFVVNKRAASERFRDVSNVFQVGFTARAAKPGFIGSPDMSGYASDDEDLRIHDLHYRDVLKFAGGRNTGIGHSKPDGDYALEIWTEPLPTSDVKKVDQNKALSKITTFGMAALEVLSDDPDKLAAELSKFPANYALFIQSQMDNAQDIQDQSQLKTAQDLVAAQRESQKRMEEGIAFLKRNRKGRESFKIMNRVIREALERRIKGVEIAWRPFQMAFILQNIVGLSDPTNEDRKIVDLLFFPTGGGKTEAYLGLAAYQIAFRRLSNDDWMGSGVSVIMRYTLRLLTLDQLDRAAAMICAFEMLRKSPEWQDQHDLPKLGNAPIEIGLWVGSTATPNRIGDPDKTDSSGKTAITMVKKFRSKNGQAPAPIKKCPWCETPFTKETFEVVGNRMHIHCSDIMCDFGGDNHLPILAVDEEIYNRLPAFLIATIDKFAALPREGKVGRFFSQVNRASHDDVEQMEFYGADRPRVGKFLESDRSCLPPPDLIIQDELHLISGPLGTVSGIYEAAIDLLSTREIKGVDCPPKIIASTATVRRAQSQIKRLFGRDKTAIFPPPGISRENSYFAITRDLNEASGRRYLGISALGIGPRKVLLRSMVPLMAAAKKHFKADLSDGEDNIADPYMTALCYFNALRELGASRRIVEDEVANYLKDWPDRRKRSGVKRQDFADRVISIPAELTSRLDTDKVAEAKDRLNVPFKHVADKKGLPPLDVALATNMISVGLDVSRLGLMLVQNQPKSAAEYIQATSRVGRDDERPGLVIAILNMHRARDRAHYENFGPFHEAFYRAVEATSVTPNSEGAKDRALGAVFAGLVRHLNPAWTHQNNAGMFDRTHAAVSIAKQFLIDRICDPDDIEQLITHWESIISMRADPKLNWQTHKPDDAGLLHNLTDDLEGLPEEFEHFKAGWSMRDVQPSVVLDVWDDGQT